MDDRINKLVQAMNQRGVMNRQPSKKRVSAKEMMGKSSGYSEQKRRLLDTKMKRMR